MNRAWKAAFVSPVWTAWQHRLMEGALHYADTHPKVYIRAFAPTRDWARTARELEEWGADGIFGVFEHGDLIQFRAALKNNLPIINTALAAQEPGVVTLVGDFSAFVETAIGHLRQLGLRSLALLVLEEGPQVRENLIPTFLRVVRPADPARVTLIHPTDRAQLWNPETAVTPIPAPVATWLQELHKPVGILCVHLGGGGYVIRCCRALGLRVPEDVAVVGSDETDLSLASDPTLTSVLLSVETLGSEAMGLLANILGGTPPPSQTVRLRCAVLNVRESTGLRRPEICDIVGALDCIRKNACRGITVDQVIRQTQRVSRVTFHRNFLKSVGKTPAEAIRERQIQEVRRLLTGTELPLGMVSDLCGFSSPKVLARFFRKVEGATPRDYRKRHKSTES